LNNQFQELGINTISSYSVIPVQNPPLDTPFLAENKFNKFYPSQFLIREFSSTDQFYICSWVESSEALLQVSGDSADSLTPSILYKWIGKAKVSLVVTKEPMDEPIGFCTLSRLEVDYMPDSYIEICHLIIDPQYRYMFIGPRLVQGAISISCKFGFRFICGRVLHTNRYGLILARKQKFEEFTNTEAWITPGFRWFRFNLSTYRK
jgi:ribosomal protein S18 acetylase RimI-like enzyme